MPSKVKDHSLLKKFKDWKPGFFLFAVWHYMFPRKRRNIAPCNVLYAFLLPNYVCATLLKWSFLDNEQKTDITLFKLHLFLTLKIPNNGQNQIKYIKHFNASL